MFCVLSGCVCLVMILTQLFFLLMMRPSVGTSVTIQYKPNETFNNGGNLRSEITATNIYFHMCKAHKCIYSAFE